MILRAANTYTAYTKLYGGVIEVQSNTATGTGALTFNGGTLRSFGQNITLGNFLLNMEGNGTIDTQTDLLINATVTNTGVLAMTHAYRGYVNADGGARVNFGAEDDDVWARALDGTIDLGAGDDTFCTIQYNDMTCTIVYVMSTHILARSMLPRKSV